MNEVFTVAQLRPARDGMTISRNAQMGSENSITYFALGKGTSISQERYDTTSIYIGADGKGTFLIGTDATNKDLVKGDLLVIPGGTLCGVQSDTGAIYTEIIIKQEAIMNNLVKAGEVMKLKDLISYEEGSISNLDVASTDTMKFVLMAFDKGTGLTPQRAPGNAIIFALDGKATINYEGRDHVISAGENFRFEKDGLHSVTADEQFKMALLLVIE